MSSIVLQMRALSPKYAGNFFQGWHLISERYISLFWKHAVWSFVKKLNRHQRKVNDENDVNVALVGVAINVDSNDTWTTPKTFFYQIRCICFPTFSQWVIYHMLHSRINAHFDSRTEHPPPLSPLSLLSSLSLSLPPSLFFFQKPLSRVPLKQLDTV